MLFFHLNEQLKSLSNLLLMLNNEQYNQKVIHLGNSSIGGHTRHIIELLQCVLSGYESGTVNYINRVRNLSLENDRQFALKELGLLTTNIINVDKEMKLITECDLPNFVTTTFYREIVYNTEHSVHHLALIKVALREMKLDFVDSNFGMAYSTIKFLASQKKIQN